MNDENFKEYAALYADCGLWPRPIAANSKACKVPNWQSEAPDWHRAFLEQNANDGIGLLMGSPLPGGYKLAALDIDDDDYVNLGQELLGPNVCGRIGKKGIALFVRVPETLKSTTFKVEGSGKQVADFLCTGRLCVLPPTIHPETKTPYRWVGKPLHEIDLNHLPIIGA
jgi:hypothetical protein